MSRDRGEDSEEKRLHLSVSKEKLMVNLGCGGPERGGGGQQIAQDVCASSVSVDSFEHAHQCGKNQGSNVMCRSQMHIGTDNSCNRQPWLQ